MAKQRRKSAPTNSSAHKPKPKVAASKAKVAAPKAKPVRKVAAPPAGKAKKVRPAAPTAASRSKAPEPAVSARRTAPEPVAPPRAKTPVKVVQPPAPPVRRSTYVDAVAMYEKGVQFLQSRKFKEAADTFTSVIGQFPEEKELHERAKLYLLVCERAVAAAQPTQESSDERVFAATLAINDGELDRAVAVLSAVLQRDPEHDHACYMMGVALALRGQHESAIQHLARSMALNAENRDLAAKEPDLEVLRRTDEMQALLASPPPTLARRDRPASSRSRRS